MLFHSFLKYLFIWLGQVFFFFFFGLESGLSYSTGVVCCIMKKLSWKHNDSLVMVHGSAVEHAGLEAPGHMRS